MLGATDRRPPCHEDRRHMTSPSAPACFSAIPSRTLPRGHCTKGSQVPFAAQSDPAHPVNCTRVLTWMGGWDGWVQRWPKKLCHGITKPRPSDIPARAFHCAPTDNWRTPPGAQLKKCPETNRVYKMQNSCLITVYKARPPSPVATPDPNSGATNRPTARRHPALAPWAGGSFPMVTELPRPPRRRQ